MDIIKNIAIIAHVDHGKTTLVDEMLKQSGEIQSHQKVEERAMDSNDQERERGITILAKCTSVNWKNTKLNIVDTPGHADFGGEVERILSMVNGVVLLVDAYEGPMPQTKFVLTKALKLGLKPMVVINKVDKPEARCDEVLDKIFDLFVALDANEEQLDFPVIYASGKNGWAANSLEAPRENLNPLLDMVLDTVPEAEGDTSKPFSMLITTLEYDSFLGPILTGRVESGIAKINMPIKSLSRDGKLLEQNKLTKLLAFKGLHRVPVDSARAGDIVAIAGLNKSTVADTLCDLSVNEPIAALPIDPPTLAMTFTVNDSPLAGREGSKVTSRMIRDRLMREADGNVAIQVTEAEGKDAFEVAGRGELQLGVLIETMRREGFELSISRPRVLFQTDENGQKLEPIEDLQVDVDEEFVGVVVEKLGQRKGEVKEMNPSGAGKTRLSIHIPARGLIGYQGEFLTDTRGTGIMSKTFLEYAPYKGNIAARRQGVLISNGAGTVNAYSLNTLEDRGIMFSSPGDVAYEGMIIGEHSRENDLEVNALRAKQLTNMRASGKDEGIRLTPPRIMSLEEAIAYINDDELVEVTPESIRLRKKLLNPNDRKRASRSKD